MNRDAMIEALATAIQNADNQPGASYQDLAAAVLDAVATARADELNAERDAGLLREEDANKRAMLHLRRAEKAEISAKNYSEFNHEWRKLADTAWNDAIEAAAGAVREKWATQTNAELEEAILTLKKES